jgi:hypothetical protein
LLLALPLPLPLPPTLPLLLSLRLPEMGLKEEYGVADLTPEWLGIAWVAFQPSA